MVKRSLTILSTFVAVAIVFFIVRAINSNGIPRQAPALPTATLTVGASVFSVEVADEPSEQAQGLSGRDQLGERKGMLFVFPESGNYTFWMKDMRFPLDLVWIKGDTVVGVTENAPPEGEHPALTYGPPEPVDKVLEVNAGTVARYQIRVGDKVEMPSD